MDDRGCRRRCPRTRARAAARARGSGLCAARARRGRARCGERSPGAVSAAGEKRAIGRRSRKEREFVFLSSLSLTRKHTHIHTLTHMHTHTHTIHTRTHNTHAHEGLVRNSSLQTISRSWLSFAVLFFPRQSSRQHSKRRKVTQSPRLVGGRTRSSEEAERNKEREEKD